MRISVLLGVLAAAALFLAGPARACPSSDAADAQPATSSAASPVGPSTPVASWDEPQPGHHEDAEPEPAGPETGKEGRRDG